MSRPPLRLLVVLGLLGAGIAAGQAVPTVEPGAPGRTDRAAVVGAGAVCTDLRQQPGAVRTSVAVGTTDGDGDDDRGEDTGAGRGAGTGDGRDDDSGDGGAAGTGSDGATPAAAVVAVRRLGGDAPVAEDAPAAALPVPADGSVVADLGTDADAAALQVRASGGLAPGLAAQQTALVTAGAVRGLATTRCGPARTDGWLLGGGTTVGETSTLLLANPDAEPAVVDVTVLSAEGPVDERPGRGLTVPARGRVAVPLDTVAPDRSRLALRVQATRGRVAAAVRHERSDGVVPRGVAYAAPADAPAASVDVPGLPAGPGGRAVWVSNPGEADVEVAVEVTTVDGQFVPEGLDAVVVPAGSTAPIDLSQILGTTPAAVRVTATGGPVLAVGVAEDAGAGDVRDLAYTGPAPPLAAPVLLPDVVLGAGESVVLLSALSGDAVAELMLLPVVGAPAPSAPPRRVDVPGGRTVAVAVADLVPAGTTGRVAVQVTPDRRASPLHAAVVVRGAPPEGPLLALESLPAAPATVPQPAVLRDPAVGAGTG